MLKAAILLWLEMLVLFLGACASADAAASKVSARPIGPAELLTLAPPLAASYKTPSRDGGALCLVTLQNGDRRPWYLVGYLDTITGQSSMDRGLILLRWPAVYDGDRVILSTHSLPSQPATSFYHRSPPQLLVDRRGKRPIILWCQEVRCEPKGVALPCPPSACVFSLEDQVVRPVLTLSVPRGGLVETLGLTWNLEDHTKFPGYHLDVHGIEIGATWPVKFGRRANVLEIGVPASLPPSQ